ncbi:MAG: hypothetical protein JW827_03665 [Spirochaetes bacterium]|nr:hypothetical protein [Spirochaetota bacterium]
MKRKIYLLVLIVFLIINIHPLQSADQYDPEDSIGFIYELEKEKSLAENVHFIKDTEITLYDKPEGKVVGKLYKKQGIFDFYYRTEKKEHKMSLNEMVCIAYDGYCLQIYEKKKDYLQVLRLKDKKGYWVSIKELEKLKYSYTTWIPFFKKHSNLYFPRKSLVLRAGPGADNKKVVVMKDSSYQIRFTGKIKGMWMQVNIELYNSTAGPCEGELIKKYKGWVKAIDDKGYPNIWFWADGC